MCIVQSQSMFCNQKLYILFAILEIAVLDLSYINMDNICYNMKVFFCLDKQQVHTPIQQVEENIITVFTLLHAEPEQSHRLQTRYSLNLLFLFRVF